MIKFINTYFKHEFIDVVFNEYYAQYGSGYSLYMGINQLKNKTIDELVFIEGDLIFDLDTYAQIVSSVKNVVTANKKTISATDSVAFYLNTEKNTGGLIQYLISVLWTR